MEDIKPDYTENRGDDAGGSKNGGLVQIQEAQPGQIGGGANLSAKYKEDTIGKTFIRAKKTSK